MGYKTGHIYLSFSLWWLRNLIGTSYCSEKLSNQNLHHYSITYLADEWFTLQLSLKAFSCLILVCANLSVNGNEKKSKLTKDSRVGLPVSSLIPTDWEPWKGYSHPVNCCVDLNDSLVLAKLTFDNIFSLTVGWETFLFT